mmetsp:Transcript_6441/g.18592  ORF Transcript_6441/g.18592 Transcript_6441/m.18592 type:complete len:142 (-) Transcript_6441:945-1370(-)
MALFDDDDPPMLAAGVGKRTRSASGGHESGDDDLEIAEAPKRLRPPPRNKKPSPTEPSSQAAGGTAAGGGARPSRPGRCGSGGDDFDFDALLEKAITSPEPCASTDAPAPDETISLALDIAWPSGLSGPRRQTIKIRKARE